MNDLNMSDRVLTFDELVRNLSPDEIARIKSGKMTEDERSHPLFQKALAAWSAERKSPAR